MKTKSLVLIGILSFIICFASCSDDDNNEKQVSLTTKVGFVQDGEELFYPVMIRIFKGSEDYFKEYNFNTQYHYFERKNDNAIYPPSYTLRPYPPVVPDVENVLISIDMNTVYTISYRMVKENTNFYFVEYDVEVDENDFILERTFVIDNEGNVTKK
jgi:hypothetical protein